MFDRYWTYAVGISTSMLYSQTSGKEEIAEYEEISEYGVKLSMKVPLESRLRITAESVGRERRIRVLHKAMKVVVGPLENYEMSGFAVRRRGAMSGNVYSYLYRNVLIILKLRSCHPCDKALR